MRVEDVVLEEGEVDKVVKEFVGGGIRVENVLVLGVLRLNVVL